MITEITVRSLGDLIDHVTPATPDPKTGRWRDSGVYRGAFDAARPLLTSLDRLGGTTQLHGKAELEEHILRNFIRYSRPYLGKPENDWELLVTAQHHGVPTRLLDWSYSPLIAAYFATRETRGPRHHGDRAIWRLDWMRMHEAFGFPKLALVLQDLEEILGGQEAFTPWRLFSNPDDSRPFACMIEPPSLDARIVVQAAVFTLCSDKTQPFDVFLDRHGLADALTKFVMPTPSVARIRDQLEMVSVDERRIFPDLDGVAAAIRHYYT